LVTFPPFDSLFTTSNRPKDIGSCEKDKLNIDSCVKVRVYDTASKAALESVFQEKLCQTVEKTGSSLEPP
jgi:hypothetical protein